MASSATKILSDKKIFSNEILIVQIRILADD